MSAPIDIDIATPMRQWMDILPDAEELVRSAVTAAWRASGGTAAAGISGGGATAESGERRGGSEHSSREYRPSQNTPRGTDPRG